jgi:hypothetical protein
MRKKLSNSSYFLGLPFSCLASTGLLQKGTLFLLIYLIRSAMCFVVPGYFVSLSVARILTGIVLLNSVNQKVKIYCL